MNNKTISLKIFQIILLKINTQMSADLSRISFLGQQIRGMTQKYAGELLFNLAYMQDLKGDVIEIGSYLGKSAFFLGNAVKLSGNGKLFAIDHFKGNKNKEHIYKINKEDLSDLKGKFLEHINKFELEGYVNLIDKPSHEASKEIKDNSVRLIYEVITQERIY